MDALATQDACTGQARKRFARLGYARRGDLPALPLSFKRFIGLPIVRVVNASGYVPKSRDGCLGPRPWRPFVTIDTTTVIQSDAELLRRVALQDREAFLELYDRYSARLLGLIITVMRNRTQAEDVLQQVMLEIWQRHAAKYSPELGAVDSWLLRLARCRAIDWARSASSRTAVSVETVPDVPTSSAPAATGNDEARQMLAAAVGELPEEERVPMVLAYVNGLTREEIAEQCGVPVGTIKTRLRRGLQRLRESLPVGVSQ